MIPRVRIMEEVLRDWHSYSDCIVFALPHVLRRMRPHAAVLQRCCKSRPLHVNR